MAEWVWLLPQALEKKGISHLEEKELKERNKRIQEDNRLELQKVDASAWQGLGTWASHQALAHTYFWRLRWPWPPWG